MFDKDTWTFINSFADWFSAVGTIAAVIVAIYLARQDRRVRLSVSADHRLIVTPGERGPHPEFLCISVTNIGHREAQLTNIGWKIGVLKYKKYAVQTTIRDGISSELPVRLRDGEEAKYFIPLTDWLRHFGKMLTPFPFPRLFVHLAWVSASTSVGRTFRARIEKGLRRKIIQALSSNHASTKSGKVSHPGKP